MRFLCRGKISLITAALAALLQPGIPAAQTIKPVATIAPYAYMVDTSSDVVLLEHNADAVMYPASMTKIMTAFVAFRALKDGILRLDDQVLISPGANRMGGSKTFVEAGKYVSVQDLLLGIIVQSGNDASVALAEFIGGSEENFASMMNDTAASIGMTGSNFVNASGWPDDNHFTTARDLAILGEKMIEEFPEYYKMFSQKTFTFSGITQKNRNGLIGQNGVDGIKTGHTEASGYGQISSAVIDGRRLIVVVNGMTSANKRQAESARLMNWGFRSTETLPVYQADDIVTEIPLWYGEKNTVALRVAQDIIITKMRSARGELRRTVTFNGPLRAPVKAGEQVAELHLHTDEEIIAAYPLLIAEDVAREGFQARFVGNINYLLWGETP